MKKSIIYLAILTLVIVSFFTLWNFNANSNLIVGEQSIFGGAKIGLTELQKDFVKKFREGNIPGFKEEAENILLSFCQKQIAKKFLVKHFGSNVTGTYYYLIGELITTNQEEYRVYISNNKTHIESIEITKPRDT
jgi:hypothetical protein